VTQPERALRCHGIAVALSEGMNQKETNPEAEVPPNQQDEPWGDRGSEGRIWSPPKREQGSSKRENDEHVEPFSSDDFDD
jgi:hypothetical protein